MKSSAEKSLKSSSKVAFDEVYNISDKKSEGSQFADCTHRNTGAEFLVKAIDKSRLNPEKLQRVTQEINVLSMLDHPNIIKLQDVFECKSSVHIVLEKCRGDEVFNELQLQPNSAYSEEMTCKIIKNIISAVRFCHNHGIVHRDLKLESILFFHRESTDGDVRLINFGLSCPFKKDEILKSPVGTPYYVAPEVLNGSYTNKCDVWSVGVIAYMLLTGSPPFYGNNDMETLRAVKHEPLDLKDPALSNVSAACKDFISKCLSRDVAQRPTAEEAQKHPWMRLITPATTSAKLVSDDLIHRLRVFEKRNALSRLCMEMVADSLHADQVKELRREFNKLDVDEIGEISFNNIRQTLRRHHSMSDAEIDIICSGLNSSNWGKVSYCEFLAATVCSKEYSPINEKLGFEKLSAHTNYVSADALECMTSIEHAEVVRLLRECGCSPAGFGFDEFLHIIKEHENDSDSIGPETDEPEIRKKKSRGRSEGLIGWRLDMLNEIRTRRSSQKVIQNMVNEEIIADVSDFYAVDNGRVLGTGISGSVVTCTHKATNIKYALKTLNKKLLKEDSKLAKLREEIRLMAQLDHPNIIRVHECFESDDSVYIVMERCTGGELLDQLNEQQDQHYTERQACNLVHIILGAIQYCHVHNVVHRDIKLENFIFTDTSPYAELRLIDFGLSQHFEPTEIMNKPVGTAYYVAPEVLEKRYDYKCDIWSIGVVAYMLLSGTPPFNGETDAEVLKAVRLGVFSFPPALFRNVSKEAKDFIVKCLTKNVSLRLTAQEAQRHPWFKMLFDGQEHHATATTDLVARLESFNRRSSLSRLCMEAVAHTMSTDQVRELHKAFEAMDEDASGEISIDEFRLALQEHHSLTDEEIEHWFSDVNFDHSGVIRYHEFIAATLSGAEIKESNVRLAFEKLSHHSDFISTDDLQELLGQDATSEHVDSIKSDMSCATPDKRRLSYEQFRDSVLNEEFRPRPLSRSKTTGSHREKRNPFLPELDSPRGEDGSVLLRLPSLVEKVDRGPHNKSGKW